MKKIILISIFFLGCSRYIQSDYNAYGVIKSKKVKAGLNLYQIEINPTLTIKYESIMDYNIEDTILINSSIHY